MLEIKPIQEKEKQREACGLAGIPYREECLAYLATVDGAPVGVCQFYIRGETGYLTELAPILTENGEDTEALFIMGRAALNFLDLAQAKYADFAAEGTEDRLKRMIGFRTSENGVYQPLLLTGMFEHKCGSGRKENGPETN